MQVNRKKNLRFSPYISKSVFQRSFRSRFKYRTIVLYLLSHSPVRTVYFHFLSVSRSIVFSVYGGDAIFLIFLKAKRFFCKESISGNLLVLKNESVSSRLETCLQVN